MSELTLVTIPLVEPSEPYIDSDTIEEAEPYIEYDLDELLDADNDDEPAYYESELEQVLGIKCNHYPDVPKSAIIELYKSELWVDEQKKIFNENAFGKLFSELNNLMYSNGLFYTKHGKATEEMLAKNVWETLDDCGISTDVERKVKKLMGVIKLASTVPELKMNPNIIPFSNGDFHIKEWEFRENEFSATPYRLKAFLPDDVKPMPLFRNWLSNLFYDDDIMVIQEFLGYSLVFTTQAQKSLFLVGQGGAGKSGIGTILAELLGEALEAVIDIQEYFKDKFKLAELENKLVLYDDDLEHKALATTGMYKNLITNTLEINADRKYLQPFKFKPTIKIIACCNEMLTAMYDTSKGFFRRLLPIIIKPISKEFVEDTNYYEKLKEEIPSILVWSLIGLKRLIQNGWKFSISNRTNDFLHETKRIVNHLPEFFETVFNYGENERVPSAEITAVYPRWCRKNACDPVSLKTLQIWLRDNMESLGVRKPDQIRVGDVKCRGYIGMSVKDEWSVHSIPLLPLS